MKDAVRRSQRAFVQTFLGVFLFAFGAPPVAQLVTGQHLNILPSPDYFVNVVVGSAFAGFVAVLSLVQNMYETKTGRKLMPK
jgi:hypothetical protein